MSLILISLLVPLHCLGNSRPFQFTRFKLCWSVEMWRHISHWDTGKAASAGRKWAWGANWATHVLWGWVQVGPGPGWWGQDPDQTDAPMDEVLKPSLKITTWVEIMLLVMNSFLYLLRTPDTLILIFQAQTLLIWSLTSFLSVFPI